jgi:succinyl-CoA synthetase beta subunit
VILYEYQAKSLLARRGVAVPAGGLYPQIPDAPSPAAPLVAKVQVQEGKRGKRGGIRTVRSPAELDKAVAELRAGSDLLPPAESVLVEQLVSGREVYLALMVDRDAGYPVLLVSPSGGVDIEAYPETLTRFPLSILDGEVPAEVTQSAGVALGVVPAAGLDRLLAGLWACFRAEECLLLEVNPCVETDDGALVAVDAKITIDDNARHHRPVRDAGPSGRTRFEAECSAAGVSATELTGDIAIIVSGAGLAMATLDAVAAMGGQARCVVDFGYSTLHSGQDLRRVLELVYELGCRVVLVNAFLQMASCAELATAIVSVAEAHPAGPGLVARLAGNDSGAAQAAVLEAGGHIALGVVDACQAAVGLSAAATDRRS